MSNSWQFQHLIESRKYTSLQRCGNFSVLNMKKEVNMIKCSKFWCLNMAPKVKKSKTLTHKVRNPIRQ